LAEARYNFVMAQRRLAKRSQNDNAVRRQPSKAAAHSSNATKRKHTYKKDAQPDRIDVRDWFYQPTLAPLPSELVNCGRVPKILDQGNEGACTGFALAAVINYHLAECKRERCVSPQMLYALARRYDEWPGEAYEGSSARGAMKGWVAHGVCKEESWRLIEARSLSPVLTKEAAQTPGGAYYRVAHRNIRDLHAALTESGILYLTLMVHGGWDNPGPSKREVQVSKAGKKHTLQLPIIRRRGRAEDGHAVAIVGYTAEGFIIQNSWGEAWGAGGFALLPYEDYLLHATDVWVAQLGVPISMRNWGDKGVETAGLHRASQAIPLADIRPYVVDVGNNGELSHTGSYWTSEDDVRRLFAEVIPNATRGWQRKRVLLYLHGGLNDEAAVARRAVAYRDVLLANGIYPLHIMWESGVFETLGGMLQDLFSDVDERAGAVADWMHKLRDGLVEAKDRSLELTVAGLGSAMWREMKENARLASKHPESLGGMQIIARYALAALAGHPQAERELWEIHVVGHSAGSIFAAHALQHLVQLGTALKSIQFLAPAITVDDYKALVAPHVEGRRCPLPSLYMLSDAAERADSVGPYGKSLLYLVSNAFEAERGKPILGMARYVVADEEGKRSDVDGELAKLYARKVDGRPALVVASASAKLLAGSASQSGTHGGFDNDVATMNSVLQRVLNKAPTRLFSERELSFESKASAFGPSRTNDARHKNAPNRKLDVAGLRQVPSNNQTSSRRSSR
jgi:hypothetical protein